MEVMLHNPTPVLSKPRQRLTKSGMPRAKGVALTEVLVAGLVIAAALGALSLVSDSLRIDTARQQTHDTLAALDHALRAYHADHGSDDLPATTPEVLAVLFDDPATAELMRDVPIERDLRHRPVVPDGFGVSVDYVSPQRRGADRGDFVSAGPDRRFGDPFADDAATRRDAADNLYASDQEPTTP